MTDRVRVLIATTALAAAATGCASSRPHPVALRPAQLLQKLAAAGLKSSYTASYLLTRSRTSAPDRVSIYRLGRRIRVDIASTAGTAVAIISASTADACEVTTAKTACYSVHNLPLPTYLDPGLERVFTTYLAALSTANAGGYRVRVVGHTSPTSMRPAGTCFAISGGPGGATAVAAGRYCLAPDGVPTLVSYPAGQLQLLSLSGPPSPAVLVPPASPTPLP